MSEEKDTRLSRREDSFTKGDTRLRIGRLVYCKKYSSTWGGSTKGVGRSSAGEGCSSTEGILVFGGEDSSTEH